MKIRNRDALQHWMATRQELAHDIVALKDYPPAGTRDDNGELVDWKVNMAWQDTVTKDIFYIEWDFNTTGVNDNE